MSEDSGSAWPVVQAFLMAGVLVACVTVTCSNSRLEQRVIDLDKKLASGRAQGDAPAAAPVRAEDPGEPVPGQGSGVFAVGWGGKRAEILVVEHAPGEPVVKNPPFRLEDKPRPQNDWYVERRNSPPRTLNYYATNEGETSTLTSYILGRLVTSDPDAPFKVEPSLAASWEISDDKLTYTFHLRKGVQFADGRPFTAADVLFSFDVMRDPEVKADHLRSGFDDVDSIAAPDPHTLVVKYRRKYWKGLYQFGVSLRILNKGWYQAQIPGEAKKLGIEKFSVEPGQPGFGEVFNKIRAPCPGTGPYYLASDDDYKRESVDLVQNPFYYGIQTRPTYYNFTKLRRIYIEDEVAAFESFRKGEFDVTVVDPERWDDQYSKDPTILAIARHFVYDHVGLDCSYVGWNCRRPPFNDARVRTAMTHLTDRAWLLREIERGRGTIAVCKSKRNYPTYSNDLVPHPFDIEKAKALLAEAGWKDTDGDGVLDKDGKPFEFEMKVPSGRAFFQRVPGQIQDACRKAGIRMSIRPLEWAVFIEDLDKREFDALMLYSSWADPWIDNYESYHSSQDVPNGGNVSGWRSPEADELLQKMREEFDEDKRTEMFHRFNKLYYDAQPETLLVHGTVDVLQNKRFEEARVRPSGMQIFELWVKPENVLHR